MLAIVIIYSPKSWHSHICKALQGGEVFWGPDIPPTKQQAVISADH